MKSISHDVFLTPARMAAAYPQGNYDHYAFPPHIRDFQRQFFRLLTDPLFNRIIVEVPVRHSKSEHWSRYYPAWLLLTQPGKNVMIVAHTQDLASSFVDWIRRYIRKCGPMCGRYLDPEQQSKHHIRVMGNGFDSECWGFGRGGSIAGRGAHYLVADDLLSNQGDDLTEANLNKINLWWLEAMARMEPNCKVAVVMSRRAPLDVSGFCLSQNGTLPEYNRWHSIKYPAIQNGQALWPERYSIGWLEDRRKEWADVGAEWMFDAEYMQDPRCDPSLSEWPDSYFPPSIWYSELPLDISRRASIVSCDLSKGSTSKAGDFTAVLYMIWDKRGHIWVEDSWLRPCPLTEGVGRFAEMIMMHRPNAAIIETMGDQIIVDETTRQLDLAGIYDIPVYPYQTNRGKPERIRDIRSGLTGWLHNKRFHFRDTPHNRLSVSQFRSFPNGAHDDAPDSALMGISLLDEHFA